MAVQIKTILVCQTFLILAAESILIFKFEPNHNLRMAENLLRIQPSTPIPTLRFVCYRRLSIDSRYPSRSRLDRDKLSTVKKLSTVSKIGYDTLRAVEKNQINSQLFVFSSQTFSRYLCDHIS